MTFEEHLVSVVETAVARALAEWAPPMPVSPAEPKAKLLTVAGAAELLNVSEATVRRLIDAGKLPAVSCFTSIRVDRRDLDAFIDAAKGER